MGERASVISRRRRRRKARGSLESPEKIWDLSPLNQLNKSFKIDLEDPTLEWEEESDEKETEETAEEKEMEEEKKDEEEVKREGKEEAQK